MVKASSRPRLGRDYFEALYADDPDPWRFAESGYERAKYAHTLAALGGRRFERGLEVGCSIGVFTAALAERCDALLAVDISEHAVRAAADRTAALAGVSVERRALPEETPAGPFDLAVCSEALYYWTGPVLRQGLDRLTAALSPGGLLIAVHWTEPTRRYPLSGTEVHAGLRAHPLLRPLEGEDRPHYRLDLLERT